MDDQTSDSTSPRTCKACTQCKIVKPFEAFGVSDRASGRLNSWCKECRSLGTRRRYRELPPKVSWAMWTHARLLGKARKMCLPFDLTWQTLHDVAPDICPALNIPLLYERGVAGAVRFNSPSVDRNIPNLGYVRSNISVISQRANQIKTNATINEVRAVLVWMERTLT